MKYTPAEVSALIGCTEQTEQGSVSNGSRINVNLASIYGAGDGNIRESKKNKDERGLASDAPVALAPFSGAKKTVFGRTPHGVAMRRPQLKVREETRDVGTTVIRSVLGHARCAVTRKRLLETATVNPAGLHVAQLLTAYRSVLASTPETMIPAGKCSLRCMKARSFEKLMHSLLRPRSEQFLRQTLSLIEKRKRSRPSVALYSSGAASWRRPVEPARSRPGERFEPITVLSAKLLLGFRSCMELCGDANVE